MGTWRGPDDAAAARFLAEHGMVSGLDGDEFVIEAGNGALLPPWPPVEYDVGPFALRPSNRTEHVGVVQRQVSPPVTHGVAGSASARGPDVTLCAVCATPVARHGDAGWRHEVSLAERGGCTVAWPG